MADGYFEVGWQGPGNRGDLITIAQPGQSDGSYVHYANTSRGNPVKLRAPKKPGQYEVRYVLRPGNRVLDTKTIEITAK